MYIPFPVVVGFTAGIAAIMFASQIKELLGLDLAREPAALAPKLTALAAPSARCAPRPRLFRCLRSPSSWAYAAIGRTGRAC